MTKKTVFNGIIANEELTVNTSGWKPGIYIVSYDNGYKKETQKITIK